MASAANSASRTDVWVFPPSLLLVPLLVLGLHSASSATVILSYFVLAAFALRGRPQTIQALFVSFVIGMLNPAFKPSASLDTVGRYIVIFAAMVSVLLRSCFWGGNGGISRVVIYTLLLGFGVVIHSILFSAIPDVSIMKAISFTIVFATILSAWKGLSPVERVRTEMFIFGGMMAVIVVSIPFLAIPSIGYLRNGTGFQGILNHPNVFGPFVALVEAWLIGRFLTKRTLPLWQITLLLLCPALILASESRGAGGALALGVALPMGFMMLFRPHRLKFILPGMFTKRFVVFAWAGLISLLAFGSLLFARLDFYISKSGRASGGDVLSYAEDSRGALVQIMVENIQEKPMQGIGFGIASFYEDMVIERDPVLGLPIGASTEKGVMPVAVVEELGIPGALLVFLWFIMLFRRVARSGLAAMVVATTALMTNLGENTFFSPGGMGLIILIMVSWAATPKCTNPSWKVPLWIR